MEVLEVGGAPGLLFHDGSVPVAAWAFEVDGPRIRALYVVANPEKLERARPGGR